MRVGVTDFTTKACRLQCILRDPIRAQTAQSSTFYLPHWYGDITPSVEDWLSFKSQVPSEEAALWKKWAFVCKLLTLSNQSGKKKKNQPNNPIKHRLQQEAKKKVSWRWIEVYFSMRGYFTDILCKNFRSDHDSGPSHPMALSFY